MFNLHPLSPATTERNCNALDPYVNHSPEFGATGSTSWCWRISRDTNNEWMVLLDSSFRQHSHRSDSWPSMLTPNSEEAHRSSIRTRGGWCSTRCSVVFVEILSPTQSPHVGSNWGKPPSSTIWVEIERLDLYSCPNISSPIHGYVGLI